MQEFAVAGVSVNGNPAPPFRNLHIRVRGQVVADGLDKPLDWQSAGYDMPPMEWHETLKKVRQQKEAGETENVPLIFDCRNDYETDVGIFEGAEPLDTANFRDSWDVFKERLKDTPKDAPIMTYCTGGIRCVKVGAYLTQEMGFTNVSRLAGGIIAYDRTLNEKGEKEEPMFKGTNFVFDGRLGRPITEDSLGTCVTCGAETSLVSNCRNDNCHKRMIQCEQCRTSFHGTCSDACRNRVVNGAMIPKRLSSGNTAEIQTQEFKNLEDYSSGHSSPLPSVYPEMEFNTRHFLPSGSHMVSGASQGRWLTQLASMSREGRVLECGTFTGFATACLLEGAANAGESIGVSDGNRNGGPYVMTMERDGRAIDVAVAHLKILCEYGVGEEAAEAACALRASERKYQRGEFIS
jgi:predicted sulfurtransferase